MIAWRTLALVSSLWGVAGGHGLDDHSWKLLNEVDGLTYYGTAVKICIWYCPEHEHRITTEGVDTCPPP